MCKDVRAIQTGAGVWGVGDRDQVQLGLRWAIGVRNISIWSEGEGCQVCGKAKLGQSNDRSGLESLEWGGGASGGER